MKALGGGRWQDGEGIDRLVARHREAKLSEFYEKSRRAPRVLIVLCMLILMLTVDKLRACSPPLYSHTKRVRAYTEPYNRGEHAQDF